MAIEADENKGGEQGLNDKHRDGGASAGAQLAPGMIAVPAADLVKIQESLAAAEKREADRDAEMEGLKQLVAASGKGGDDKEGLRKRKTYEPKFRTVRIRKYPIAGDPNNLGYVVGWTDRGAYQKVDRTGVSPQIIDYLDIIFLGHERNAEGKLQAESVPLLDLLNRGIQVHCKIVDVKKETHEVPTGEEIDVTTWDPQHGLVATGDKIDGFVAHSDIQYTIDIPGKGQVTIDGEFVN